MPKHARHLRHHPVDATRPRHSGHPPGLVYTILRHGRGLSHESAALRSQHALETKNAAGPHIFTAL